MHVLTTYFEAGLSLESGALLLGRAGWPGSLRHPPAFASPAVRCAPLHLAFPVAAEDQTQTHASKGTLDQLSYLPSSTNN